MRYLRYEKKSKSQQNCTDYLGIKGVFAKTGDMTTTTKKSNIEKAGLAGAALKNYLYKRQHVRASNFKTVCTLRGRLTFYMFVTRYFILQFFCRKRTKLFQADNCCILNVIFLHVFGSSIIMFSRYKHQSSYSIGIDFGITDDWLEADVSTFKKIDQELIMI